MQKDMIKGYVLMLAVGGAAALAFTPVAAVALGG